MSEIDRTIGGMDSETQRRSPCVGDSACLVTSPPGPPRLARDPHLGDAPTRRSWAVISICFLRPFESTMELGGPRFGRGPADPLP